MRFDFKRLKLALLCLSLGAAAIAQTPTPTPTPEQLNMFRSLPPDQQESLIQSILGGNKGDSSSTSSKFDSTDGTDSTKKDNERQGNTTTAKERKTADGRTLRVSDEDPELRPFDYVLIDLTPLEMAPKDNGTAGGGNAGGSGSASGAGAGAPSAASLLGAAGGNANAAAGLSALAGSAAGGGTTNPAKGAPSDFGRVSADARPMSLEQLRRSEAFRDRILKGNPYQLNQFGVLEIPGLPSVPLSGLTADEATRRLSADQDLRDYTVKVSLLRLTGQNAESAKPFGYDLFEGSPSTFAPVKDVPVPTEYVIGPGDTLLVQLYGNENQSYTLTVGRDGRIYFPKLGPINVSNIRFDDARAEIERRVSQQFIGTHVNVSMGALRSIRVFVLGEAQKPGSYSVSGLSTMTNALFASGGVKKIGSLRKIELKRAGRTVSVLDLYDLLLRGDTSGDHQLMSGDVIFIPPIGPTVTVYGAVRRPAIYELKGERDVAQLIDIAGGLSPDADPKTAQLERIAPARVREMRNVDLSSSAGLKMDLLNGDQLRVPSIRPTLENSVELTGYVYRPGAFEYRPGLRLSDVLSSFEELRPNADHHYILIRRQVPPDEHVEALSADLDRALAARGSAADPELKPRDKIYVFDLTANRARTIEPLVTELELQSSAAKPAQVVSIDGEVRAPGRYALEPSMHVSDLIRAGGSLEDSAYGGQAELTRYQVVNGEERQTDLIEVNLAAIRRGDAGADPVLKPYDILLIKRTPQWDEPGVVVLRGEVRFPGTYPILRGETLSSVVRRAGGLTDLAFDEGTIFLREELKAREKDQLEMLSNRLQADLAGLALEALTTSAVTNGGGGNSAAQGLAVGQQLIQQLRNTKPVGRLVINIDQVMRGKAGAPGDVVLRDGDTLLVPKKTQDVTILGEVQSPTSHVFQAGLTRDDYIARSGGTTQRADHKRIYVVRANGDVVTGHRGGWFRRTQTVEIRPGDTIVVPMDTERVRGLPLWTSVTTIIYNLAVALLAIHSV
jgi:protein involved in polysaccharide export with SLBB domain